MGAVKLRAKSRDLWRPPGWLPLSFGKERTSISYGSDADNCEDDAAAARGISTTNPAVKIDTK